jgi:hypothetical protein
LSKNRFMTSRPVIAGALLATSLLAAGCSDSSSGGGATTVKTPVASDLPTAKASDIAQTRAIFDGAFKGVLALNLCTSSNVGSVQAKVDGDTASNYLGSISTTGLNFKGPQGGIYSTKPGTRILVMNGRFDVNGVVLTDELVSGKSVTVHGTLTCP